MQHVKMHAVYEEKNTIETCWAYTNKGTLECPNIRSRWVAKQYNTGPRPDLLNATSPLEGVKLVISETASSNRRRQCSW